MARSNTVRAGGVYIAGLNELVRDLRAWDRKAPRLVSTAHRKLARKVAAKAKTRGTSQGSVAAKAAKSLRASGTVSTAAVLLGGPKAPYAMGAEFGSYSNQLRTPGQDKYQGRRTYLGYNQFLPWKGNSTDAGYFLWPTIRDMQEEIADTYISDVFGELERIAFPEGGRVT